MIHVFVLCGNLVYINIYIYIYIYINTYISAVRNVSVSVRGCCVRCYYEELFKVQLKCRITSSITRQGVTYIQC